MRDTFVTFQIGRETCLFSARRSKKLIDRCGNEMDKRQRRSVFEDIWSCYCWFTVYEAYKTTHHCKIGSSIVKMRVAICTDPGNRATSWRTMRVTSMKCIQI